jgi:hypothetical protein
MAQVRGADPPGSRLASSACLSRRWACSAFVATDLVGLLPVAFAALPLGLLLVLVPLRWWRARRGQLDIGLPR